MNFNAAAFEALFYYCQILLFNKMWGMTYIDVSDFLLQCVYICIAIFKQMLI